MVIGMEFPTGLKRRIITPLLKIIKNKLDLPDFELSQVLVIENVEHLVGLQAPDSVGAFFSVFCHDFTAHLVELYEVRPL